MRKKPYREGDWFAVPIDDRFVVGRIARVGKSGGILLGYFFDPTYDSVPTAEHVAGLTSKGAFYITRFTDGGLRDGSWPIIQNLYVWQRDEWPMPAFGRIDAIMPERGYVVRYDEYDLSESLGRWLVSPDEAMSFPKDGLAGHLWLEEMLKKYFRDGQPPYDPLDSEHVPMWFRGLPE